MGGPGDDSRTGPGAFMVWRRGTYGRGWASGLFGYGGRASIAVLALLCVTSAARAGDHDPLILALGDSLTAGYGLQLEQAYPFRLAAYLAARGITVRIDNAGVSGDTTAGGRERLDWALADKPGYAIVELGANDALRGLDPKEVEANLDAILTALDQRGVKVLLAGMLAPPNLGRDYGNAFRAIYPGLAAKHHALLYSFFLDGVAGNESLLQEDGLHPTAAGVDIIVARIAPLVEELLREK